MTTLLARFAGYFDRNRPEQPALSTAYLIDGDVYLDVRTRDRAGNDYVLRFLPKVPLASPGDVLGAAILEALAGAKEPVPGVPPEERMAFWRDLVKAMGFSARAFESASRVVMMSGTPQSGVTFQPTVREKANFVGMPEGEFEHCAWSENDVAHALATAFTKCC